MKPKANRNALISIAVPVIGIPFLIAVSAPVADALGDSEWGWLRMFILAGGCLILMLTGLGFAIAAWSGNENRKLALLGTLINLAPVAYVIASVAS